MKDRDAGFVSRRQQRDETAPFGNAPANFLPDFPAASGEREVTAMRSAALAICGAGSGG
ncbi:MAG TPA: hypothetical protein VHE09_00550 [Rhizomicrobium sp.]|nr:hypothetical protein [Rhizomicrobium sp.]